tara:strand:- start:2068 stop:3243 length:1176 start_codon:yes stop_codon:yes gene_type:complete
MAGRINLAVTGVQDQWLTGKPDFSYFLMNFKRHTKFSIEAIESPFDGTINFDTSIKCTIPSNKGDLIRSMMLKFTLPRPTGTKTSENHDIRYIKSIGANIIDHADLLIGGQTIERITGDYIYMYNQIHHNGDDIDQTLYFLTGHNEYIAVNYDWDYSVMLPFYFFRHPSLAIPVCALKKQLVEIRIKFKKLSDVTLQFYTGDTPNESNPPSDVSASIKKASLITDFFFVSEDERNFLISRPIEYVITQLQMSKFKMDISQTKKAVMLNFKHPVKEMFFIAYPDLNITGHVLLKNVTLKFNNQEIINTDYNSSYTQALRKYTGYPNNFDVHSFSLIPETYYPTGQVNFSRIAHQWCEINLHRQNNAKPTNVFIYAVNYNILHIESGLGGLKF